MCFCLARESRKKTVIAQCSRPGSPFYCLYPSLGYSRWAAWTAQEKRVVFILVHHLTAYSVPWWFVYKLPDSYQFAYKDSNDLSASLSFSNTQNLNTTNNPIAYTLNQVYHNKKSITYLAWNDEFPSLKRTVGGKYVSSSKNCLRICFRDFSFGV